MSDDHAMEELDEITDDLAPRTEVPDTAAMTSTGAAGTGAAASMPPDAGTDGANDVEES